MVVPAFLSYSSKDKILAGKVKKALEEFGFDVFLAHDSISPSVEWQREILKQVRNRKVFIALLTNAFDESEWTDQETGFAIAKRAVMVPLDVEKGPSGFLKSYQAIRLDSSDIEETCFKIAKSVASRSERFGKEIRAVLIKNLGDAESYDGAGSIASKLRQIDGLTSEEINQLLMLASENSQVYESGSASTHLRQLISKHRGQIRKRVFETFRKVWRYR